MRRLAPVAMEAAIADWAGAPYTLTQKQAPATYSVTELAVMVFLLLLAGCASHHQGAGASGGASATGANASRGSGASNRTGIALDLVGYSSTAALGQLAIPITEADVDFYLRIMRSTLERLQHLSPQDQVNLATYQQWLVAGQQAASKALAAERSGNFAAVVADAAGAPPRTPAVDAAQQLLTQPDDAEAALHQMPSRQWEALRRRVESASSTCSVPLPSPDSSTFLQDWATYSFSCFGGDTRNPFTGLTAAQLKLETREAAQKVRTIRAESAIIAPHAAEIRQLQADMRSAQTALSLRYGGRNP